MQLALQDIFPTKFSVFLFVLYVTLFVNQGILVTTTQESDNSYNYDTSLAVFLTELIKFIASAALYLSTNSFSALIKDLKSNLKVGVLYIIPGGLYCIYNNLSYVNLSHFDPTTYFMALQLRVVITGVVFQCLFKKFLSSKQWVSLCLLTCGCMVKQVDFGDSGDSVEQSEVTTKEMNLSLSTSTLLLLAQILCSCLAGVYNEFLLKSQGEVEIHVQNIFHYLNSMFCLCAAFTWQGQLSTLTEFSSYEPFLNSKVFFVVLNSAAIGIVTSFFLKHLNSILKNFASSIELALTAVVSRIVFSIPIYINTILSIFIIIVASITYSQNPVVNAKPKPNKSDPFNQV